MSDPATRIASILDELASITAKIGFEAVTDAVSFWENTQADTEMPDWHEVLGSGLRHALDVARDVDNCADTCHIRITWSDADHSMMFRFDAAKGAGAKFSEVITTAVDRAVRGTDDLLSQSEEATT